MATSHGPQIPAGEGRAARGPAAGRTGSPAGHGRGGTGDVPVSEGPSLAGRASSLVSPAPGGGEQSAPRRSVGKRRHGDDVARSGEHAPHGGVRARGDPALRQGLSPRGSGPDAARVRAPGLPAQVAPRQDGLRRRPGRDRARRGAAVRGRGDARGGNAPAGRRRRARAGRREPAGILRPSARVAGRERLRRCLLPVDGRDGRLDQSRGDRRDEARCGGDQRGPGRDHRRDRAAGGAGQWPDRWGRARRLSRGIRRRPRPRLVGRPARAHHAARLGRDRREPPPRHGSFL